MMDIPTADFLLFMLTPSVISQAISSLCMIFSRLSDANTLLPILTSAITSHVFLLLDRIGKMQ